MSDIQEMTEPENKCCTSEPDMEMKAPVVIRRSRRKKRKKSSQEFAVEIIPATVGVTPEGEEPPVKRVAAYCRVSTDQEAQSSSYDLQVKHYTEFISAKEGWILAGIYADEGISGTQTKHREQFLKMMEDCRAGGIDMILTKSISRFSRNVVDCLTNIRLLKELNPPVEVYFEKENLSSLDDKTDMVLSLMASIAQEESRSISANISWAIRNRMKDGTQKIPTACLLGYDTDEDGNLVVIPEEAEIVKFIYRNFVQGMHPDVIAQKLNRAGNTTVKGNKWSGNSVRNILQNEKYCGDVLMQKTFTVDYLTHRSKKNEGERDQFFIADHHEPIVTHEVWDRAKLILEKMNYKNWKRRDQQRLIPLARGLLAGFVPVSPLWRDISISRLINASEKVLGGSGNTSYTEETQGVQKEQINTGKEDESEEMIMSDLLKDFEVVDIEVGKSDSVMTVSGSMLKFNKPTATELMYPSYVRVLIDASTKRVAIQSCTEKTRNAVAFSKPADKQMYAVTVKIPAIVIAIRKLLPELGENDSLTFKGQLFVEDKAIIYDLSKGEPVKRRARRKKVSEENEGADEVNKMDSEE